MLFRWSLDLTESKHKSYVLFRCGLNSTTVELHGDVIGSDLKLRLVLLRCLVSEKVQEVSLCGILFILLVGLAYDLMFYCQYYQKKLHQVG